MTATRVCGLKRQICFGREAANLFQLNVRRQTDRQTTEFPPLNTLHGARSGSPQLSWMEQGPDFWCWFDTTQFSYHCVHPIHAKMFSIQMLLHFSQIVQRVCTLVLFILSVCLSVCVFSLFWHLAQSGVQTAVSATSARCGHEI